ncbi:MAG: sigma-70 family RNA polymerase sigma factor [Verrucomicrobiota bacterium]|nr:sigma-70 family RNA polymerase sigma factor [Verrucomicrobiota bacterium]
MGTQDSPPVEAELLQRIAQGDRQAFAALYDCYAKPLYSFAVKVLNDSTDAEDVLQEVFLQIWEKAAAFDETVGKPFSWAVTMTRNKAIDRLRSKQRRGRVFEEVADNAAVMETAMEAPVNENFFRDEAIHVRAAVIGLPKEQRHPIELAFFCGLTHLEIAEQLKEPLGTIKARIRRGLLRLRNGLEGRI